MLALAAVVAGFAVLREVGDGRPSGTDLGDLGVEHVHGLGINPASGALYVATHHGTFVLPEEDRAERLSDSYQDTMGFTVAGPDRFLGSGHPDVNELRSGRPPLLGLIESTDAGKSWEARSLEGEVDFHALAFVDGRVYGWDSTSSRFMVSDDLETWETRSAVAISSFSVDPDDRARIIAAGSGSLVESVDGGRTWHTIDGPPVAALSWDDSAGLWGADGAGRIHRSSDGRSWEQEGRVPGSPQALLATDDWLYAASDDAGRTGIYRSPDGARWDLLYRDRSD